MTKYEITLTLSRSGEISHVVKSENIKEAQDRIARAYPDQEVLKWTHVVLEAQ